MNHLNNLIIKFIMIGAITVIFLSLLTTPAIPFLTSIIIAIFITGILYAVGDLWALPRYGNSVATGANALMAAIILWLANFFIIQPLPASMVLLTAIVIGIGEWFFHRYLKTGITADEGQPGQ